MSFGSLPFHLLPTTIPPLQHLTATLQAFQDSPPPFEILQFGTPTHTPLQAPEKNIGTCHFNPTVPPIGLPSAESSKEPSQSILDRV